MANLSAPMMKAQREAAEDSFFEYHLYTLPGAVSLAEYRSGLGR